MWPFGTSAQARFEEALSEQELTKPLGLEVEVRTKVAFVTGKVPNDRYPRLVTAMGGGINGIERVDVTGLVVDAPTAAKGSNEGAVKGAAADPAENPSAMAQAVLVKLRADAHLANDPVDVLQKGSTIVLRGAVDTEKDLARAKALASSVPGVTDVDASGLQFIANAAELNVTDDDGDVVYTVKSGDTLSHIALRYYGGAEPTNYMKIAEANGLADANKIQVGQQLKIPGTTRGPDTQLG